MSVSQWRGVMRAFIGIVWVIVGIGLQISRPDYAPGDWRGDPTISTIVDIAIVLAGTAMIMSAAAPFVRKSGSS